jgi:prefoldin beta subunit
MAAVVPASSPNNPGTAIASAVDAETAKFRVIQEELQQLSRDLQVVFGQETENEMVLQELDFVSEESPVYKMIGPVLVKQDPDEAQQTLRKRLEFIRGEKEKLQSKIKAKEEQGNKLSVKVQQMQAQLQATTAQAVQAIAEQHKSGGGKY